VVGNAIIAGLAFADFIAKWFQRQGLTTQAKIMGRGNKYAFNFCS
jgi:hypothetical protein